MNEHALRYVNNIQLRRNCTSTILPPHKLWNTFLQWQPVNCNLIIIVTFLKEFQSKAVCNLIEFNENKIFKAFSI